MDMLQNFQFREICEGVSSMSHLIPMWRYTYECGGQCVFFGHSLRRVLEIPARSAFGTRRLTGAELVGSKPSRTYPFGLVVCKICRTKRSTVNIHPQHLERQSEAEKLIDPHLQVT